MGILNVTPDSFFDGGRYTGLEAQLKQAEQMLREGAHILDIGGYSSRPGAEAVSLQEELDRVLPAIEILVRNIPDVVISIDTFRAQVAREAVQAGAAIINDISGGDDDPAMFETVAELKVPYILMHKKGTPKDMQLDPQYDDVVAEVMQHFSYRVERLRALGVSDIVLDPGFGFGKTLEHNYQLLKALPYFKSLACPILAGVSRKSMVNRPIGTKPENGLNGTTVVNTLAVMNGADILRVHDVKPAREVLTLCNYYRETV